MSTWRRIAIENLPSFQRVIEESDSIVSMWIDLFHEVSSFDGKEEKPLFEKNQMIYRFALECLCADDKYPLALTAPYFFEYLLNIREEEVWHRYYFIPEINIIRRFFPPDCDASSSHDCHTAVL